jgi:peptidylprolyl isomerase
LFALREPNYLESKMPMTVTTTKAGSGPSPKTGQTVFVNCTGYVQETGKKFWSTADTGVFSFKVGMGQVIPAWDHGLQQMKLGEAATIVASHDLAYGERGFPDWGIPGRATLRFEIELLEIK